VLGQHGVDDQESLGELEAGGCQVEVLHVDEEAVVDGAVLVSMEEVGLWVVVEGCAAAFHVASAVRHQDSLVPSAEVDGLASGHVPQFYLFPYCLDPSSAVAYLYPFDLSSVDRGRAYREVVLVLPCSGGLFHPFPALEVPFPA
jgi:hypothetical protein